MNLGGTHDIACGDTCLRGNWWKRNKQARSPCVEGRVDPRGASLAAASRVPDASMTPTPGTYEAGSSTVKLLRADAPIDRKRVPGDVLGLVGEQPDDRISDLFGLANPTHRDK
jgi:hypothetical protein